MLLISEYIVEKALDAGLKIARKILKEAGGGNSRLLATVPDLEESINHHLRFVNGWSKGISFNDLIGAKSTTRAFIQLDLYIYPRRMRQAEEVIESIPLKSVFEHSTGHIILLGQPGAGKTTSMMYLCQALFRDENFYGERFSLPFNFPILIKFRELNGTANASDPQGILNYIYNNILGLRVELPRELPREVAREIMRSVKEKLVISFLEQLKVLLILDGFDELSTGEAKKAALGAIKFLASHLEQSTMIVTSRTADFNYKVDNAFPYEICELSKEQISMFAARWLEDERSAANFIEIIYNSPFLDTTIRPLTLAHLCALYQRNGRIPEKPKSIYKRIIDLLLTEWDEQNDVNRHSRYARFQVDRKSDFLRHMAYVLTTSLRKTVFSKLDVLRVYQSIHAEYGLEGSEAKQVVAELETHTGLFVQSGFEEFEFAHKSLQEYLTAEYLVRLPTISDAKDFLAKLPNELAIAVALSNATDYLGELVTNRFMKHNWSEEFIAAFVHRLLLEKPDFNRSNKSGLVLLVLYTLHVRYCFFKQPESFDANQDTQKLEEIIRDTLADGAVGIVRNNYRVKSAHKMKNGERLYYMERTNPERKLDKKILGVDFPLPYILYMKSSFLYKSVGPPAGA